MPIVSTGQITIVDVNDGLDVNLSANSVVLAADTAGTVASFAAAETTMSIREAGVDTTSTWAFYVSATGGGISYRDSDDTVDRTGTGAVSGQLTGTAGYVKVVALSQDLSYLDVTATKGSQTVVRRFSVAKARQGATGGPGPTGPRGTITTSRAITGTAWSDTEANTAISNAGGGTPIQGDVVTLYNTGASFSATRVRSSGGTWSPLTAFFGGDIIVDNTLAASKIVANSITAGQIATGGISAAQIAAGAITAAKLLVTGQGDALNADPNTQDAGAWAGGTFSVLTDSSAPTGRALEITSTGVTTGESSQYPIDPTRNYQLRITARQVSGTSTCYLGVDFFDASGNSIVAGPVASGWPGAGSFFYFGLIASQPPASYTQYTISFGPNETAKIPSNAKYVRVIILGNYTGSGVQRFSAIKITEKAAADLIVDGAITATKLAANSIAVGTAAIETGAITNAMIQNLTIDGQAKIANGTIVTANIGDGEISNAKIGNFIQSTNYVAGTAGWHINKSGTAEFGAASIRGQLTASQINSNGLTIRDNSGNILFGVNNNIDSSRVNAAAGWLNSNISISGGAIQGIGSGSGASVDNSYQAFGVNMIRNSDMTSRTDAAIGWNPNGANIDIGPILAEHYFSNDWSVGNYFLVAGATRNAFVHQNGIVSGTVGGSGNSAIACDIYPLGLGGSYAGSHGVPVVAGKRYCFSAYVQAHRCNFVVGIAFLNNNGDQIGGQETGAQSASGGVANSLSIYTRSYVFGGAPAGSVSAVPFVRKLNTFAGEGDSWLWWAAPMLEEANTNAQVPSPYAPGPSVERSENILDSRTWVLGRSGSQRGFPQLSVTTGGANFITDDTLPDGSFGTLWRARSGTRSNTENPEGGWNTNTFPINHLRTYRFTVWMRRLDGNGSGYFYLGPAGGTVSDIGGGVNGNPYFVSHPRSQIPVNEWVLVVGYVQASTSGWGQQNKGGVFRGRDGVKIISGTDFKWVSGIQWSLHRCYQYYTDAPNNYIDFFDPRVELCDGSEPSVDELLAMGSVNGRKPITASNASTYIASAAIGDAQIANTIQSTNYSSSAGWQINKSGTATFNEVALRGAINGGAFTGWSWPAAGNYGFHLGPNGLLLGNANNGRYFQVTNDGQIYAPGFQIVNGSATFSGTLSGAIVNTDQIVGNAAAAASSTTTTGATASITVSVPANASAILIQYYLGPDTFTAGGKGGNDVYGPLITAFTDNGSTTSSVIVSPSSGNHTISITRSYYTGTMRLGVVVLKR